MTQRAPTTDEIEWVEELPTAKGVGVRGVWVERLAPFHGHPRKWGKLPGLYNTGAAGHITGGFYSGVEAGDYEACARKVSQVESNKAEIWVRYVGNGDAA